MERVFFTSAYAAVHNSANIVLTFFLHFPSCKLTPFHLLFHRVIDITYLCISETFTKPFDYDLEKYIQQKHSYSIWEQELVIATTTGSLFNLPFSARLPPLIVSFNLHFFWYWTSNCSSTYTYRPVKSIYWASLSARPIRSLSRGDNDLITRRAYLTLIQIRSPELAG